MPIYINDIIENLAPAPTIRGSQNQVTGWLYAEVGGTAANGWNLIAAFRDTKSSVVSGTSVYIFTGSDTTDGQWQNASNWSEVSGSGGGGGIPEAPIDNQKYAREDAAWVVVTDGTQGEQGIQGVPGTDGTDGTMAPKEFKACPVPMVLMALREFPAPMAPMVPMVLLLRQLLVLQLLYLQALMPW